MGSVIDRWKSLKMKDFEWERDYAIINTCHHFTGYSHKDNLIQVVKKYTFRGKRNLKMEIPVMDLCRG